MESTKNRDRAYYDKLDKLPAKRKEVLKLIFDLSTPTAYQISKVLKVPINRVTGRIRELKDGCYIKESALSYLESETGQYQTIYKPVQTTKERIELILEAKFKLVNTIRRLEVDRNNASFEETRKILAAEIRKIENKIKLMQ